MRRTIPMGPALRILATLIIAGGASGCAAHRPDLGGGAHAVGFASYYAREHDGRRTASGEIFDMQAMTAAHRSLPFGTRVRVTNLENGRQVVVRVTDRGPFRKGRIIDVSYAAARVLGLIGPGVAKVRVDVL
jgi:rare lipoprotein A